MLKMEAEAECVSAAGFGMQHNGTPSSVSLTHGHKY